MLKINSNQYRRQNTTIAITIGILILLGISFRVLFPTFLVSSNNKDDFFIREIGGKKYLEIKIKNGYPFHKLDLQLKGKNLETENFLGNIYQNELDLYPVKEKINSKKQLDKFLSIENSNNLKNGELIQKNNSVYFIENGMYRAFSNAETFDSLGFDWDKVQKDKAEFLEGLEKGKNITLATSYLPGSFVEVGKKLYLFGDGMKYEINLNNEALVEFVENNFSVIKTEKERLLPLGHLDCQGKKKQMHCKFVDNEEKVLPRATILIEMTNDVIMVNGSAKISTFDKFNSVVPIITLRKIKERLIGRYNKRLRINR